MGKFIIEKSRPLNGRVRVCGAKNSVLPVLAASLLTKEDCVVKDTPFLKDVVIMLEILCGLGAQSKCDYGQNSIFINCADIGNNELPYELVKKIRASFLIAGPLLARFGKVKIQTPGGCPIGVRPIDLHLKGFSLMGAEIKQEHGSIEITARKLRGADVYLDFPSVGATENIIMAAVLAEGVTNISNCAVEPEIVDLADFLNSMGALVEGAGSDNIKITGVDKLHGCTHTLIPDRIEAGTYMVGAAITKGDVIIENVICEHLKPVSAKLREMNVEVEEGDGFIRVKGGGTYSNTDVKTMPFPGFPTDMQAQFMSLMAVTKGTGIVNETIFENRFMHVGELNRMGADIKVESKSAVVRGVDKITGTQVRATDLRAGAALILSALAAEGTTEIADIYHIERGYYKIEEKLRSLGADIKRIDEGEKA